MNTTGVIGIVEVEDEAFTDVAQVSAFDRVQEVSTATVGRMAVSAVAEGQKHTASVRIEPHDVERVSAVVNLKGHLAGMPKTRTSLIGVGDDYLFVVGGSERADDSPCGVVVEVRKTAKSRSVLDRGLGICGEELIPIVTPGPPGFFSDSASARPGILLGDLTSIIEEFQGLAHGVLWETYESCKQFRNCLDGLLLARDSYVVELQRYEW